MLTPIALAAIVILPLYYLWKFVFGSHPLDKIPGPRGASWWNGYFEELLGAKGLDFHFKMAQQYGPTFSFKSLYGERQLYTFDPKAMHHIFVKDQGTIFEEPFFFTEGNQLMFGRGLLSCTGERHRKQRKMLNPVFSVAYMRNMVPTFYEITHKLRKTLISKVQDGPQEIDVLSWMSRTALELIGQSGLGYSFDDLQDEEHAHPYIKAINGLMPLLARALFTRKYIFPHLVWMPPSIRRSIAKLLPWKDLHLGTELSDFMWEMSTKIVEEKKKKIHENKEFGAKDLISVLIQENDKATREDRLQDEEVIGQISTFTFAATDTTSSALSRILSLLAVRLEVQAKLREEINEAFQDGDISYDQLVSLPYLDAIARETLRLHPPVHRLFRTTLRDTVLPLSTPVTLTDGSVVSEIFVPRGTDLFLSLVNANRNKLIWGDDVDEWKPERWLSPLPERLIEAKVPGVYSHLMTFIGGRRSCIGFKFSQLEMKVVLSLLIKTFEFSETGKKIHWLATGVTAPMVTGPESKGHPELPLIVKLAKEDL